MTSEQKTANERKALLSRQVSTVLSQGKTRIESQSDYDVVLVKGRRVNHILHLVLTLFTGVWCLVWLLLVIKGGEQRLLVQVDEWGNLATSEL